MPESLPFSLADILFCNSSIVFKRYFLTIVNSVPTRAFKLRTVSLYFPLTNSSPTLPVRKTTPLEFNNVILLFACATKVNAELIECSGTSKRNTSIVSPPQA